MEQNIERIAQALEQQLFVELEASGRHVHLSPETERLFFPGGLTVKAPLSQPGQFASHERVTLTGPKGKLERVAVLGPSRAENQAEVSLTDAVTLGLTVPVRLSGDTKNAPIITMEANGKQVPCPVIVAKRHIHMTPEDAARHRLQQGDAVSVHAMTDRPTVFKGVTVRISDRFATRVHLDYDEANACHFRKGDLGVLGHA